MAQAATVARGHVPEDPLEEVGAYLDFRAFGSLPAAGGTLDQPAWLMAGMRVVHSRVMAEEDRRARAAQRRPKR